MKVSQRLYEKALPIWESYFTHPFIQGMADGTLAKDKFQFYMIQDHKYLMEYAKVFALGVIKSRDEKDMRAVCGLYRGYSEYGKCGAPVLLKGAGDHPGGHRAHAYVPEQ